MGKRDAEATPELQGVQKREAEAEASPESWYYGYYGHPYRYYGWGGYYRGYYGYLTDTGGREKLRTNKLDLPLLLQLTLRLRPAPNLGIMVTMAIPTDTTVMEATMEVITDIPTDTGGREMPNPKCKVYKN